MTQPKPLLAPNEQIPFDDPRLPNRVLVSHKLDGMRVLAVDGILVSRNLKPLRAEIQDRWRAFLDAANAEGLVFDGEIFEYGNPNFGSLMSTITRGGADVPDTLGIYCFDCVTRADWGANKRVGQRYQDRMAQAEYTLRDGDLNLTHQARAANVLPLTQFWIDSPHLLEQAMDAAIDAGTEGLIARDPNAQYKHGRGTLNEGIIFKFKKWETQEGRIIGYKQATVMTEDARTGEREKDAFGNLKQSHKQETRELTEGIGSFQIRLKDGREIGAGIKKGIELSITWDNRESYLNKWVEVEYMEHGSKSLPRFSRITRLRPDLDVL